MNWFHGATAPCSMVRLSSGTSTSRLTSRTVPVPEQAGHAPSPLNASCSALGPKNSAPHSGQTIGRSAATLMVGGAACPLGQRWLPRRENMRRREIQQLGLRPEGGADARHGGPLVQRERGRDVFDAFHVRCGGRGHAAARVGGKRLQIAPRPFGVQDAQGERRLARAGNGRRCPPAGAGARRGRCRAGCARVRRGSRWRGEGCPGCRWGRCLCRRLRCSRRRCRFSPSSPSCGPSRRALLPASMPPPLPTPSMPAARRSLALRRAGASPSPSLPLAASS